MLLANLFSGPCLSIAKGRWKGVKWDVGDYCFSKRGSLRGLVYVNGLCDWEIGENQKRSNGNRKVIIPLF